MASLTDREYEKFDDKGRIKVSPSAVEPYRASDVDASSPAYYGFLAEDGSWYIMKETVSGAVTAYRYVKGASDYSTNWTGRADLTYELFSEVF